LNTNDLAGAGVRRVDPPQESCARSRSVGTPNASGAAAERVERATVTWRNHAVLAGRVTLQHHEQRAPALGMEARAEQLDPLEVLRQPPRGLRAIGAKSGVAVAFPAGEPHPARTDPQRALDRRARPRPFTVAGASRPGATSTANSAFCSARSPYLSFTV